MGDVVFVALHEIGHPMLCHLTRRGSRDPKIYGLAIDIVLNKLLAKVATETPILGMTTPKCACIGEKFGMSDADITTVEEVYEKLMKQAKKNGKPPEGKFDDHGDPKNPDGSELTEAQRESVDKDWKVSVRAAADMAKKMGKLPGFMSEFIDEMLKPKVDWRSQLWAATKVAKDESSYRRFNRRQIYTGTYLPGNYSERIGAMGYTMDVSGSVSSEECKQGLGEMNYILEELKPERIYFGQCDTRLVSVEELTVDSLPLAVTIKGRGGTNMKEAFMWACENEDELDMFVMQTDGEVPPLSLDLHPRCPVIIIKTTKATLPAGWDFPTVIEVEV